MNHKRCQRPPVVCLLLRTRLSSVSARDLDLLPRLRYLSRHLLDPEPPAESEDGGLRNSEWIGIVMATVIFGCVIFFLCRQSRQGCPLYRHARQVYQRKHVHDEITDKSTVIRASGRHLQVSSGHPEDYHDEDEPRTVSLEETTPVEAPTAPSRAMQSV